MKKVLPMHIENREKLFQYINILIKENHLKETDDTIERDVKLFKEIFSENMYQSYEVINKSINEQSFNLKLTNGMKIKFRRLLSEVGKCLDYSITISSPLVNEQPINLMTEIQIARHKHDLNFCKNLIDEYVDNIVYSHDSLVDDIKEELHLNKREKLIFENQVINSDDDLAKYDCQITYKHDTEYQVVSKEQAANIISKRYSFSDKIKATVERIACLNFEGEKLKIQRSLDKGQLEINGEEMLMAMKEMHFDDEDLIKISIEYMLRENGFFMSLPQDCDIAILSKNYLSDDELILKYDEVKRKIDNMNYKKAEKIFDSLFDIDNIKNLPLNMRDGIIMINYYYNKDSYFKRSIESKMAERNLQDYLESIFADKIHYRDNMEQYYLDLLKEVYYQQKGAVAFAFAPFILKKFFVENNIFITMAERYLVVAENPFVKNLFTNEEFTKIKEACNNLMNGNISVEALRRFEKVAFLTIDKANTLDFKGLDQKRYQAINKVNVLENEIEQIKNEIKFFMLPKKKEELNKRLKIVTDEYNEIFPKWKKWGSDLTNLEQGLKKINYIGNKNSIVLKKDVDKNKLRKIINDYEAFITKAFIEFPLRVITNKGEDGHPIRIKGYIDEKDEFKVLMYDTFTEGIITTKLDDYVKNVLCLDFEKLKNNNSIGKYIADYYEKFKIDPNLSLEDNYNLTCEIINDLYACDKNKEKAKKEQEQLFQF